MHLILAQTIKLVVTKSAGLKSPPLKKNIELQEETYLDFNVCVIFSGLSTRFLIIHNLYFNY